MSVLESRRLFVQLTELLEAAPVPISIAGGAVRDVVLGRSIKDFDLIVTAKHVDEACQYLVDRGFDCVLNTYDGDESEYTDEDIDSNPQFYDKWEGCIKYESGLVCIDLLVIADTGLPTTIDLHHNAVSKFDNSINQFIWYPKTEGGVGISYIGDAWGVAKQLKQVPIERLAKLNRIITEVNWYVPATEIGLAQASTAPTARAEQTDLPRIGKPPQFIDTELG